LSNSPIAAGQHAALLTIDTACHGLGATTGAIDRLAGDGVLSSIFHMNRLSIHGNRIGPAVTVFDYFHTRPIDRQYLGNAFK
jgi:hypothetical protein